MNQFTIPCTEEQTKKALELGAPLQYNYQDKEIVYIENEGYMKIPTAEQMVGWLEEYYSIEISVSTDTGEWWGNVYHNGHYVDEPLDNHFDTRIKALLATIDVALDYLIQNK